MALVAMGAVVHVVPYIPVVFVHLGFLVHNSNEHPCSSVQKKAVVYRSGMNQVLRKNFAISPILEWIATLTTHIPNKGSS